MNKRVTIVDISARLGVAPSTVNRALNGSAGVGAAMRSKIQEVAREMNYKSNKAAKSLSRKTLRLGFIAPKYLSVFHDQILRGIVAGHEEIADYNVALECRIVDADAIHYRAGLQETLREMADTGMDGIVMVPSQDLHGLRPCVAGLAERGIAVTCVVGDLPDSRRAFTVCQNGAATGQIAAELLWWFTTGGKLAVFTGHSFVAGNPAEVMDGFLGECASRGQQVVGIYDNFDDADLAALNTGKLLEEHPDVSGLYIASANSVAVCRKLEELGWAGRLKLVASDCFPELSGYMQRGTVHAALFQDPFCQGRTAILKLFAHIDSGEKPEGVIFVQPQIILKSNLAQFL